MKNLFFLNVAILLTVTACIKDDFVQDNVDPTLRIIAKADTIALGESFLFDARYLNNIGREEVVSLDWQSSNPDIININENGLAEALQTGNSTIRVEFISEDGIIRDSTEVSVGEETVITEVFKSGAIQTTSSYALSGDFSLHQDGSNLILEFADNYNASTSLPGLYIYLTNNPSTTSSALEIGKVEVFSGEHSYNIADTDIADYSHILYFCKPFNVKVGDGLIE